MNGRYLKRTEAVSSPVTVMALKDYLRIDHDDEDDLLAAFSVTAKTMVEQFTQVILGVEEYSLFYDEMPSREIMLQKTPVIAVEEVRIYGVDGQYRIYNQPADFTLDQAAPYPRVILAEHILQAPQVRAFNALELRFKAGFLDEAKIPPPLLQAIRMMVGYLYQHRGDEAVEALMLSGARALLAPYKMRRL
jgi:uncharacterized phiE125 gp8 family phage protein